MFTIITIFIVFLIPSINVYAQDTDKSIDRITTKYVSVLKQPGYDWDIDKDKTKVGFVKFNKKTVESHFIVIVPYGDKKYGSFEELDKDAKKNIEKEFGSRYELIEFEREDYKVDNVKCSQYYYLVKDLKVPKRMKKFDFMYVENISTFCLHPHQKNIAINIFYSHRWRYTRDPIHEEYRKQANEFLEQIQFVE